MRMQKNVFKRQDTEIQNENFFIALLTHKSHLFPN